MTAEDFTEAYEAGFQRTVRCLASKGVPYESANDIAQAAWAGGWEKREQLRDSKLWINTIALNVLRSQKRSTPPMEIFVEEMCKPKRLTMAAEIDAKNILERCKPKDRLVLQALYIEGFRVSEIATQTGWSEMAVRIRLIRARDAVKNRVNHKDKGGRKGFANRMREIPSREAAA
jgi:RNA polymerase sigma factor (sigma-70 family)